MKKVSNYSSTSMANKYGLRTLGVSMPSSISDRTRLIVEISTIIGKSNIIAIPFSTISSTHKLKNYLLDKGFAHDDKTDWYEIQNLLKDTSRLQVCMLATRPGFHGHCYFSKNRKPIGNHEGSKFVLDPDAEFHLLVGKKHTLKEWNDNVAYLGKYSSRIMLSLCAAFSAYIIRWTDIETGGLHFYGDSSIGKSSCLYIATSIYGPRESLCRWATTSTGIEETATAYCDLPLTLDELKLLHEDPKKAAQLATNIIYKLTTGQGKRRAKSYQDISEQNAQRWIMTILSTGEDSLSTHAKSGGPGRLLGEEVRMPDVPADAGYGMGIFETLPDDFDRADKLAESIDKMTKIYYGAAHRPFLKQLTGMLNKDEALVCERISKQMDHFLNRHNIDGKCGVQTRLARRFALAYAAGIFAVRFKVLNFNEAEVFDAISKCYMDTVGSRAPSRSEQIVEAHSKVSEFVCSAKLIDIMDKSLNHTDKAIRQAEGYITIIDNQTVRAIPRKALENLVGDKAVLSAVVDQFRNKKRLAKKSGHANTRQVVLPTKKECKKRCICFLGASGDLA